MSKSKTTPISRRSFLALTGTVSATILAQPQRHNSFAASAPATATTKDAKKYPIGLELYSVRTELMRDLPNTLKTVAKIGYEVVEFYAPYFNWTLPYTKDVRTQLDDLGLRCYSTHNHIESFTPGDTMAKAIELNQILGARQVVLSSAPGGTKGLEGWKKLCEQLTRAVDQLKPHGLSAGFHERTRTGSRRCRAG